MIFSINEINFKSLLSNSMKLFLYEQETKGLDWHRLFYVLKQVDRFAIENNFNDGILSKELVTNFYNSKLAQKLKRNSLQTIGKILRDLCVSIILNKGKAWYITDLKLPPKKSISYYIPSKEEIIAIVKRLEHNAKISHQNRELEYVNIAISLIVRVIYIGGLRPGETRTLKKDHIHIKRSALYIEMSKNNKSRFAYIPQELIKLLLRFIKKFNDFTDESEYIFPSVRNKNTPFTKSCLNKKFRAAWIELHGSSDTTMTTPHKLRHAYCVHTIDRWAREGKNIDNLLPYLASQMGHSFVDDTLYYYHQVNESSQAIKEQLERHNNVAKGVLNAQIYEQPIWK